MSDLPPVSKEEAERLEKALSNKQFRDVLEAQLEMEGKDSSALLPGFCLKVKGPRRLFVNVCHSRAVTAGGYDLTQPGTKNTAVQVKLPHRIIGQGRTCLDGAGKPWPVLDVVFNSKTFLSATMEPKIKKLLIETALRAADCAKSKQYKLLGSPAYKGEPASMVGPFASEEAADKLPPRTSPALSTDELEAMAAPSQPSSEQAGAGRPDKRAEDKDKQSQTSRGPRSGLQKAHAKGKDSTVNAASLSSRDRQVVEDKQRKKDGPRAGGTGAQAATTTANTTATTTTATTTTATTTRANVQHKTKAPASGLQKSRAGPGAAAAAADYALCLRGGGTGGLLLRTQLPPHASIADLRLEVSPRLLCLHIANQGDEPYLRVPLPCAVLPNQVKATCVRRSGRIAVRLPIAL